MAKTLSRAPDATLYEDDFDLLVERQADLLGKGRLPDLDVAHLVEYGEGAEDLPEACPYMLEQILSHDWFPINVRARQD
jgi:hypothetical protein